MLYCETALRYQCCMMYEPPHVTPRRFVQYTYACLIGMLCKVKNESMICTLSIFHDLKLRDFVHFVCHMHRDIFLL